MARSKPNPYIVENKAQAEGTMAELAAINRKLGVITEEMNAEIDAAKRKAQLAAQVMQERKKDLESALAVYATLNRQNLFPEGTKSLDLGYGIIGFRASTRIMQQNKVTAEMSIERLHQFGLTDGIRVKEEINKEAMATWTDEKLEIVGLRRQKSDGFFVEIKIDVVPKDI